MSQIESGTQVLTLVNTFYVLPENQQRLLDILDEATRKVMSRFPDFISANVHASLDGTRVMNYAQWRDEEYLHKALAHPDFLPHYHACNEIAKAEPILYRVCFTEEGADSTSENTRLDE